MLALFASISIWAQTSGTCGPNLTWTFQNGVLTVSGTGDMADYYPYWGTPAPWNGLAITSIIINNGITCIGRCAFYGCASLTSVTIGNSVTSIGNEAFYQCRSLTSVTIPNSVTSIGDDAFYQCRSLTSVTIGNSVTSIGNEAFYQCLSLTSVTTPNSVTSIGDYAFYKCDSLTSVTFGNSVTSIGSHAFFCCEGLTSVTFPNSLTSIGEYAFKFCHRLTSVTIPDGVTSIGMAAFMDCYGLDSLSLGASVVKIGAGSFRDCPIKRITCHSIQPPSAFYYQESENASFTLLNNTIVYVPAKSLQTYKNHSFWGKYTLRAMDDDVSVLNIFAGHTLAELLANPETRIFTLQGSEVTAKRTNLQTGVYVLRLGNKTGKVIIQ